MAQLGQHAWTCPDCGDEGITLTLNLIPLPPTAASLARNEAHAVLQIDDADVRAHLLMHEMCTCGWTWGTERASDGTVRRWTSRTPKAGCPVHRYTTTPTTEGSNPHD